MSPSLFQSCCPSVHLHVLLVGGFRFCPVVCNSLWCSSVSVHTRTVAHKHCCSRPRWLPREQLQNMLHPRESICFTTEISWVISVHCGCESEQTVVCLRQKQSLTGLHVNKATLNTLSSWFNRHMIKSTGSFFLKHEQLLLFLLRFRNPLLLHVVVEKQEVHFSPGIEIL